MRVSTVTYGRTYSKNYQSVRVEITIELDHVDTYEEGFEIAKAIVDQRVAKEQDHGNV